MSTESYTTYTLPQHPSPVSSSKGQHGFKSPSPSNIYDGGLKLRQLLFCSVSLSKPSERAAPMKPWLSEQPIAASLCICQQARLSHSSRWANCLIKTAARCTASQAVAPKYRALAYSQMELGKETVGHSEDQTISPRFCSLRTPLGCS